ncbi:hypothetical protein HMPREF9124_0172 [Oribacterium sp. oral taxon 108 str. F0425]|nr:hypothetical protein HMPREF9124_0172 [Oribacterium sp. oral taxon 108 str. F0425]
MCKFYIKPFLTNKSKVFKVVLKTEVIMNKKVPVWALFLWGVFYFFYKPKAV